MKKVKLARPYLSEHTGGSGFLNGALQLWNLRNIFNDSFKISNLVI